PRRGSDPRPRRAALPGRVRRARSLRCCTPQLPRRDCGQVRPGSAVLPRLSRPDRTAPTGRPRLLLPARLGPLDGHLRRRDVRSRSGRQARAGGRHGRLQRLLPPGPRADHRRHRAEQRRQDHLRADLRAAASPRRPRAARAGQPRTAVPPGRDLHAVREGGGHRDAPRQARGRARPRPRHPRAGDRPERHRDERELQLDDPARRPLRRHRDRATDPRARIDRGVRHLRRRAGVAERGDGEHGCADRSGEPGRANVQDPQAAGRRSRLRLGDRREVRPQLRAADGTDRLVKVFLLHPDRDFDVVPELRDGIFEAMVGGDLLAVANIRRNLERTGNAGVVVSPLGRDDPLTQDLELETLWAAMAAGDEFLYETAKRAILSSLADPAEIRYRQGVLVDCLEHPDIVRRMYGLALEALESERKVGSLWHRAGPDRILSRSVAILRLHVHVLRRLRQIADDEADRFACEGFTRFFAMLREELDDAYLKTVERHLRELKFGRGVLMSAELGTGNKGRSYLVRTPRGQRWRERLLPGSRSPSYSFTIQPRDENGFRALEEI